MQIRDRMFAKGLRRTPSARAAGPRSQPAPRRPHFRHREGAFRPSPPTVGLGVGERGDPARDETRPLKLLVGVDDGTLSLSILPLVAHLAARWQAEVEVLQVSDSGTARVAHDAPRIPDGAPTASPAGDGDHTLRVAEHGCECSNRRSSHCVCEPRGPATASYPAAAHAAVRAAARRILRARLVVLVTSDPAAAIINYACERNVDLIAMPSRARSGFSAPLAGVTDTVARSGVRPVLVCHAGHC